MTNLSPPTAFADLTPEDRTTVMLAAMDAVETASRRYADLCVGIAADRIRNHFPDAEQALFRVVVTDQQILCTDLVMVRTSEGVVLWNNDKGEFAARVDVEEALSQAVDYSSASRFPEVHALRMLSISEALDDATDAVRTVAEEDRA